MIVNELQNIASVWSTWCHSKHFRTFCLSMLYAWIELVKPGNCYVPFLVTYNYKDGTINSCRFRSTFMFMFVVYICRLDEKFIVLQIGLCYLVFPLLVLSETGVNDLYRPCYTQSVILLSLLSHNQVVVCFYYRFFIAKFHDTRHNNKLVRFVISSNDKVRVSFARLGICSLHLLDGIGFVVRGKVGNKVWNMQGCFTKGLKSTSQVERHMSDTFRVVR